MSHGASFCAWSTHSRYRSERSAVRALAGAEVMDGQEWRRPMEPYCFIFNVLFVTNADWMPGISHAGPGRAADHGAGTRPIIPAMNATPRAADAGSITRVAGIEVGHFTETRRPAGCTVILTREGAVAGVDVRGAA
eukprot:Opistho-2@9503